MDKGRRGGQMELQVLFPSSDEIIKYILMTVQIENVSNELWRQQIVSRQIA